jgi:glyoxalase family protein
MHHISATASDLARTDAFLQGLLGLSLVKRTGNFDDPTMPHWTWGSADARPGSLITYFELSAPSATRAVAGAGQTHHYALAIDHADAQDALRERLQRAGVPVSAVQHRASLRTFFTRDPDGHLIEVATPSPAGVADDQPELAEAIA